MTPGRAAYEALYGTTTPGWEELESYQHDLWEAAAQAAIEAHREANRVAADTSVILRQPLPDEGKAAYEAYLNALFAPVREEMARLRAAVADGTMQP